MMATAEITETKNEVGSKKLRERLIHAGLYKSRSTAYYYLAQVGFVFIPVFAGWIVYRFGFISFNVAVLMGLMMGIGGVIAPGLWLDYCKASRQTKIRRSIPDALDVIIICVEAGLSLNAAITRVAKELNSMHALLSTELRIVQRQIQIGKSNGEALKSFAERFDLTELRSLSSVVIQSEKFGSSISSALRVHSESLRKKRMQAAEEKAQKAAVWILLPTVICIFPALFVVILGPAAFDIMDLMKNMSQ